MNRLVSRSVGCRVGSVIIVLSSVATVAAIRWDEKNDGHQQQQQQWLWHRQQHQHQACDHLKLNVKCFQCILLQSNGYPLPFAVIAITCLLLYYEPTFFFRTHTCTSTPKDRQTIYGV